MSTPNSEWPARHSVQNTARRTAAVINALSAEVPAASAAGTVADVLRAHGEPGPVSLSAHDIAEMREVADSLREVFAAEDADMAAAVLNPLLQRTTGTFRLTSHSNGSPWHPHLDSHDDAPWGEWFLASSCLALAVLVWDRQRPPGGRCASPRCRDVFVTLNSGPARRYCSRRCATRERVAAHRRAQA
ncbi:CGNR zinc finger domain-containing protein [Streptomyces sp. NPDC050610]|uniref:CGNR zinc finger domain-containing protein n=1 Tax=Streptomyces sp. NPDC050610 TaxID=3157097 RepID=UPI003436AE4B